MILMDGSLEKLLGHVDSRPSRSPIFYIYWIRLVFPLSERQVLVSWLIKRNYVKYEGPVFIACHSVYIVLTT